MCVKKNMYHIKRILLQGVNAARTRLGDEDVDTDVQLKQIKSEIQELRKDIGSMDTKQAEKLDRIESGVNKNSDVMNQFIKQVDRALQPRWKSVFAFAAVSVVITIVIMLTIF